MFIFIPYYFNVGNHVRFFFSPWKRIVIRKTSRGFSLQESIERLIGNLASRGIGAALRFMVITAACAVLTLYVLAFPVLALLLMLVAPAMGLWNVLYPAAKREQSRRDMFIHDHCLEPEHRAAVLEWFARWWQARERDQDRFSLEHLLSVPPVGRDWHFGFTPTLDQYSSTLQGFEVMGEGLSDRDEEIAMLMRELTAQNESNVLLVGDEGVGKHTIVYGLAQRLYEGRVSPLMQHMRMVELHMDKIMATANDYEQRATFLQSLLEEARAARNIVLVINNFHLYVSRELTGDFSAVWLHFAALPYIKLLGITTPFYFQQVLFNHEKLQELFHKVEVREMGPERVMRLLQVKALLLERRYHVIIPYEALLHVIDRSTYYITHMPFPEKAIDLLHEAVALAQEKKASTILPQHIDELIGERTHMPVGVLPQSFTLKLKHLEEQLNTYILGQSAAISEIAGAAQNAFIADNRRKPKLSLLLFGPTGVGKTETAKVLASIFFGNRSNMIRLDMSFYQTKERMGDLIGSFEHKQVGMLASSIREHPFSVLLIDEFEKAHPEILNIFLTLLDEGYLTDGFGKKIDGKNLTIIATSNAPSPEVFPPELLGRFDKVLSFVPLTLEIAQQIGLQIAGRAIEEFARRKKITVPLNGEEVKKVVDEAFDPRFGAREVKRAVVSYITGKVAQAVL